MANSESRVDGKRPVEQLVLRFEQLGDSADMGVLETDSEVKWRTVDEGAGFSLCAKHAFELKQYMPQQELRAVLNGDQIMNLVIEFGLRREDLMQLHARWFDEKCGMCGVHPIEGHVCLCCKKPLHPEWPAVYCSNGCAANDR